MTAKTTSPILPHWVAHALLAIAPLCWAANLVLAKGVVDLLPPIAFAFWRWVLAFLLLLPFAWRHARRDWATAVAGWKSISVLAMTGIAGFPSMLYAAVHTTTAINGSLIQTTMPGFIILLSMAIFGEKVSARQLVGAATCVLGAATVVLKGDLVAMSIPDFAHGDILMTLAVILYAIYSLLLGHRPSVHPLSLMVYTFALGALGLFPLYLWELSELGGFTVCREIVLSIVFVALFPSIVAYFCWNRGIDVIGPNRGGLYICLIPVFASILAISFIGETLKTYHIAGMIMIVTGMAIFRR